MVFDTDLRLQTVGGPGSRTWRYAERGVVPGRLLDEVVTASELAVLGPFYRAAFAGPGTLEYHSVPTGLDFHFAAVPMTAPEGHSGRLLVTVTDVTERKAADEALRAAEQSYRTTFEAAPVGITRTSLDGKIRAANRAICEMTGYSESQLCGMTLQEMTHRDDVAEAANLRLTITSQDAVTHEQRLMHAAGHHLWVETSATLVAHAESDSSYLLTHYINITDRKRFDSQLRHLADHDPLTGVRNRRSFHVELDKHINTVARHGPTGALFMLDLDHFKQINDSCGHHAGDDLIRSFAAALEGRLRTTDVIGRLGGDEFAVLLPNVTADQAQLIAADLLDTTRTEVTVSADGRNRGVTTSIGIAMCVGDGITGDNLLVQADIAMYAAKAAGRNRYSMSAGTG